MSISNHLFNLYSAASLLVPVWIVSVAVNEHKTAFSTLVDLTSFKLNLLIFFNGVVVLLLLFSNFLTWVFFGDIRIIEQKYVMDKSQKKIFQFLLLSIVLRNTFDIYKMLGLAVLFFFCVIHWLVNKRSDYLVSRGSRDVILHGKMMVLQNLLIGICFIFSYVFYRQFALDEEAGEDRISKVYVIIGFEFIQLFLKGIQHNFKYQLTAIELYYREQWVEKGFVLNISRFIFDSLVLMLNAKLFLWIFVRGQFPLYLLGESIDTLIKLYKSVQLFIKSRTIVNQLKRLPDVDLQNEANRVGVDTTCIICLEEMNIAKKLRCGHIFHLSCLRRWIEQNVQCPTCRTQIALDQPEARPPGAAPADEAEPESRRQGARQGRDVRLLLRQQGLIQRRRQQQQERDERIRVPSPEAEPEEVKGNEENKSSAKKEALTAPEPSSLIEEAKSPAKPGKVEKEEKSTVVKNIFQVSEFDVLREMGDKEPEELFGISGEKLKFAYKKPEEEKKAEKDASEDQILGGPKSRSEKRRKAEASARRLKKKGDRKGELEFEDMVQECIDEKDGLFFGNDEFKNPFKEEISEDSDSDYHAGQHGRSHKTSKYQRGSSHQTRKAHERMEQLDAMIKEMQSLLNQQTSTAGSVAYGLPTIALTRRTLDVQIKAKQIEMINDKLIRIMRRPQDYVDVDDDESEQD